MQMIPLTAIIQLGWNAPEWSQRENPTRNNINSNIQVLNRCCHRLFLKHPGKTSSFKPWEVSDKQEPYKQLHPPLESGRQLPTQHLPSSIHSTQHPIKYSLLLLAFMSPYNLYRQWKPDVTLLALIKYLLWWIQSRCSWKHFKAKRIVVIPFTNWVNWVHRTKLTITNQTIKCL